MRKSRVECQRSGYAIERNTTGSQTRKNKNKNIYYVQFTRAKGEKGRASRLQLLFRFFRTPPPNDGLCLARTNPPPPSRLAKAMPERALR